VTRLLLALAYPLRVWLEGVALILAALRFAFLRCWPGLATLLLLALVAAFVGVAAHRYAAGMTVEGR
jgi:hypothetical protein